MIGWSSADAERIRRRFAKLAGHSLATVPIDCDYCNKRIRTDEPTSVIDRRRQKLGPLFVHLKCRELISGRAIT
jgi:hypothetical protein